MGKKLVSFLMLVTLVIGLVGCVGEPSMDAVPSQTVTSTPQTEAVGNEEDMIALFLSSSVVYGDDIRMEYSWSVGQSMLHIKYNDVDYSLERVVGSDRYWCLYREGGYVWLVDILAGKLLDPLAGLEQEILNHLSEVNFSPDGKYALISYKSGTVLELLDIATGNRTKMPYEDGIYTISGHFLDSGTALLVSTYQDADGQSTFCLVRYDIATETCTDLPGRYTAKDKNAENFMALLAGSWAYTYTDGKLTVVDLRTLEKTVYSLTANDVTNVSYYATTNSIVATAGETKYLLNPDGTMEKLAE